MSLNPLHIVIIGMLTLLFGLYLTFVVQWYIVGAGVIGLGIFIGACVESIEARADSEVEHDEES